MLENCPVCKLEEPDGGSQGDNIYIVCKACGQFGLSRRTFSQARYFENLERINVSAWLRQLSEVNEQDDVSVYTEHDISLIRNRPLPGFNDRAMRLLLEVEKDTPGIGKHTVYSKQKAKYRALSYSLNFEEVAYLFDYLKTKGLITIDNFEGEYKITPEGYIWLDENRKNESNSDKAFIAMSFSWELRQVYLDGIKPGVVLAGYDPVRIDNTEHINKIDDEIIIQIRDARFVVADFTEHKGGVYFEAGYALGLELPIFWTCRRDHLESLHFDIRQYNCIDWDTPEELSQRLSKRIRAVMGDGPRM